MNAPAVTRVRAVARGDGRGRLGAGRAARRCPSPEPSTAQRPTVPTDPRTRRTSTRPGRPKDGSPPRSSPGFLVAMQANPLSTSVARDVPLRTSAGAWKPNRGTIVYEAFEVSPTSDGRQGAAGRHPSARRARWLAGGFAGTLARPSTSAWCPRTVSGASTTRSTRWSCRPRSSTAASRGSTSTSTTRPVGSLLPGPGVHPARGADRHQPRPRPARRSRADARRDQPLGASLAHRPRPVGGRHRERGGRGPAVARRAPGLARASCRAPSTSSRGRCARCRASSGCGSPSAVHRCRCPGGRIDAPVTSGAEFDAAGPPTPQLWGLRGGRVVDLDSIAGSHRGSPLGRPGYSMRSLAVSESPRSVAAVSGDGTTVFVAPADGGARSARVTRPVIGGTDILRPSYDMFGDLWLVDRTRLRRARARRRGGNQVRRVRVPGVTGAKVAGVLGRPRRQPPGRCLRRHAGSVGAGHRHPAHRRGDRLRAPGGPAPSPPGDDDATGSSTSAGGTRRRWPC